jgi:Domain of unknown function (DUF1707)
MDFDPREYPPPWHAAPLPGYGRMLASRADKEQVISQLKHAFLEGRLTKDEYDERLGRALVSRTYADLARLTGDLPVPPPGHPFPKLSPPVLPPATRPNRPGQIATITLFIVICLILYKLHAF